MATKTSSYNPSATGTSGTGTAQGNQFLESVLPGIGNLTNSATSNIQNLLSGLPSVDATRQSNAYFGAGSGMPGSDFVRNRGYDLYGQQAQANQQTGLQDLLSTIGSYSSPVLQNQGQQFQNTQFGQGLAAQTAQNAAQNAMQQQGITNQNTQFNQNLAQNQGQFTQAQGQQNTQFGQSLAQNQNQFNQNYQLNSFDALLQALGLGNNITNSGQLSTLP